VARKTEHERYGSDIEDKANDISQHYRKLGNLGWLQGGAHSGFHAFIKLYYDRKIEKNGLRSRADTQKSPGTHSKDWKKEIGNIHVSATLGTDATSSLVTFRISVVPGLRLPGGIRSITRFGSPFSFILRTCPYQTSHFLVYPLSDLFIADLLSSWDPHRSLNSPSIFRSPLLSVDLHVSQPCSITLSIISVSHMLNLLYFNACR